MAEIKHTPGPWESVNGTVNAEDGSVFCIADCYTPSVGPNWSGTDHTGEQYQLANARLIAAAPDLLALLVELIDIEGPCPGNAAWASKVHAAIAKATGASHD